MNLPIIGGGSQHEQVGVSATSTNPVTASPNATIHTKGNWAQLIASTARRIDAVTIIGRYNSGGTNDSEGLYDIGLGGAGSEIVLLPNLLFGVRQTAIQAGHWVSALIPIRIPAATRVAVRYQMGAASGRSSQFCLIGHTYSLRRIPAFQRAINYGADTATSRGVNVDAGAAANTKGAYTEITAATTTPIKCFFVMVSNALEATRGSGSFLVDIAIGAAASEVVLVSNLFVTGQNTEVVGPAMMGPFFADIPSGVRLAARAQCDSATAANRHFDVAILALY